MVHYISFLIVFVSLLFIGACEKKEVKNETLKIAAIEPLSGPYAAVGQDLIEQLTFYADLATLVGIGSYMQTVLYISQPCCQIEC